MENAFSIVIASHISNQKRIDYLLDCLTSLSNQTVSVSIYLSISFDSEELKELVVGNSDFTSLCSKINLRIRENKTPQMRHLYLLYQEIACQKDKIADKHDHWIMFCDDDDTYEAIRVEKIISSILSAQKQLDQQRVDSNSNKKNKIAGLYESSFGKDHREHRHEYWCYCVHIDMMRRFYEKLEGYPDIIDNKCCDVLFAEYLRRSGPDLVFCQLQEKLYNYRVEDNSDSITGYIKGNQERYTRKLETPTITSIDFAEYVVDWNECLYKNREVYLHDIFLRTIVGCNLDYILQAEFRSDCTLFSYVDASHLEIMKEKHEYWRSICNTLFDIPFS